MKHLLSISSLVMGLCVMPLAMAHHSFQAEYDQTKPLVLVGKLTKVVTENPHGWIYLAVKNASGRTVTWQLETPGPGVLQRNGFTRDFFDVIVTSGEEVTVTAFPAKDESKHGWAGGLTRADGRTVIPISAIPGQGGGRGKGPQGPGQ
ncbi:MAG: DUF6152 family protein [Acidobacteriota bacterium]